MKKPLLYFLLFIAVLLGYFSLGVISFISSIRLNQQTMIVSDGKIESLIGFYEDKRGNISFCVNGPMLKRTKGEYQLEVPADSSGIPEWSEMRPYKAPDGTMYLYVQSKNIRLGCSSNVKAELPKFVSLSKDSGRIIVIAKNENQPVTNIVVKNVVEYEYSTAQMAQKKLLDAISVITAPVEGVLLIFALMFSGA